MKLQQNNFQEIPHSQTLWINEECEILLQKGQDVIRFGFGESPFSPPDWITKDLINHANDTRYLPVQGLSSLQKAAKKFHAHFQNLKLEEHETFIAPGSKLLLYACQAAFKEACILIPAPAWVSYYPQAKLCGHESIIIHCQYQKRWRVTPENLEKACKQSNKQKIFILNYPGNPDGLSYSQNELDELAKVAKAYNCLIIADEIYNLLDHRNQSPSISKTYPEGTIITTGLSKCCGAGGWRLGIAFIPKILGAHFFKTLKGIASETYSCTSSPIQHAAVTAYNNPEKLANYFKSQQRILHVLGTYITEHLNNMHVKTYAPEGGFYVYPDFEYYREKLAKQSINNATSLCQQLLKQTGIALLPGTAFNQDPNILSCRLAYVDFDGDKCLKQFSIEKTLDKEMLLKACPKIPLAMNRIAKWLEKL